LCKEAADLIGSASGASSPHREVPVQRIVRDLNALTTPHDLAVTHLRLVRDQLRQFRLTRFRPGETVHKDVRPADTARSRILAEHWIRGLRTTA
jgi:hypothetical protein